MKSKYQTPENCRFKLSTLNWSSNVKGAPQCTNMRATEELRNASGMKREEGRELQVGEEGRMGGRKGSLYLIL